MLNVYAWTKPGVLNFGDELGPAILEGLGVPVQTVRSPSDADIVACGSVLTHVSGQHIIVWGSGTYATQPVDASRFEVRAVRGETSRKVASAPGVPMGDPGLLASLVWPRQHEGDGVGWVPHYRDSRRSPGFPVSRVIDVLQPVEKVVDDIQKCSAVVSSSLHGLIVAQSYGIPTLHEPHFAVRGGLVKFYDHMSALDVPMDVIQRRLIESIKDLL